MITLIYEPQGADLVCFIAHKIANKRQRWGIHR